MERRCRRTHHAEVSATRSLSLATIATARVASQRGHRPPPPRQAAAPAPRAAAKATCEEKACLYEFVTFWPQVYSSSALAFWGRHLRSKPPMPSKSIESKDIKTTQDHAKIQKSTHVMRRSSLKDVADQRADNEDDQQHGTCTQSAMPASQHMAVVGNHAFTRRRTSHNQQTWHGMDMETRRHD